MKTPDRHFGSRAPAGVALILVMLAILVLSVLAASIVFSARSEAFASYNYRISTQADYVAKAGLQKAVNFFNSDKYTPVAPPDATTYYDVSQYSSIPVVLYNTKYRPVQCIANCPTANGAVVLSIDSSGNFTGNYPTPLTNVDGATIGTAFKDRFYNVAINPLSSAFDSGQFTVKATLEEYYTVNDAFFPAQNLKPFEVWYIESTGTWNSNVGSAPRKPTSVQQATLAPVYLPFFANALYGLCSITLNGTVCTDSYNSKGGNYNGAAPQNCVTSAGTAANAFASGAGVGSGGGVTLNGGSYVVNGDVSYGATPPTYSPTWTCPSSTSGVTGSVGGVKGAVQPVPAIPEPPMPSFPSCEWYGTAGTTCSKNVSYATPPNPASPGNGEYVWVKEVSGQWYFETLLGGTTTDYSMTLPTWLATTSYSAGTVINAGNGHAFTVTTAGLSGSSAPSWPTTSASTVTDGATPPNWAATTAYTVGTIVRPSPPNGHAYKAISAGTSGPTQPAFPTTGGATVSDSTYPAWQQATPYAAGVTILVGTHLYTSQSAGISGGAPTWNTTGGSTTNDGIYDPPGGFANNKPYAVGDVMIGTGGKVNGYVYKCTIAGTVSTPQPTWTTTIGATQANGTATFINVGLKATFNWREVGTAAAVVWREVGPDTPVTWTESGTNTNIFGAGTSSDPFRLPALSIANNSNLCLTGGADVSNIIYYDVEDFYSLGTVYIVNQATPPATCPPPGGYTAYGFAAVNIYKTMTMGGPGVTQPAAAPPSALIINVYNQGVNSGQSVRLTGQANLKAVVTALGDASIGGGGSGGAFYGAILAGSITDSGTTAVHYDQSLQVASGKLMPMTIRNYNRPKF